MRTRVPAFLPRGYNGGINGVSRPTPERPLNRIVCELCGPQGKIAFTEATPDGKLDLRNRCADCRDGMMFDNQFADCDDSHAARLTCGSTDGGARISKSHLFDLKC